MWDKQTFGYERTLEHEAVGRGAEREAARNDPPRDREAQKRQVKNEEHFEKPLWPRGVPKWMMHSNGNRNLDCSIQCSMMVDTDE